jgi:hypothetical protein
MANQPIIVQNNNATNSSVKTQKTPAMSSPGAPAEKRTSKK